jgi:hypothetical protein
MEITWEDLLVEARRAEEEGAIFEMPGSQAVKLLEQVLTEKAGLEQVLTARQAGRDEALLAMQGAINEAGIGSTLMKVVVQNTRRKLK